MSRNDRLKWIFSFWRRDSIGNTFHLNRSFLDILSSKWKSRDTQWSEMCLCSEKIKESVDALSVATPSPSNMLGKGWRPIRHRALGGGWIGGEGAVLILPKWSCVSVGHSPWKSTVAARLLVCPPQNLIWVILTYVTPLLPYRQRYQFSLISRHFDFHDI
jgi:hypothetical protein